MQEGSNSPADVFYTENTPVLEAAARARACSRPSTPRRWPRCPAATTRPQGDWVGVSARVSALVYNTAQAQAARSCPSSILELASPQWKGKVGFAPSETDFQPLITAIIKLDGRRRGRTLAEGPAGQRQDLPRQRDRRRPGQQRRERRSARSTTTTGTACATRSAPAARTRRSTTSPPATPATSSTSPAPRSSSRAPTRPPRSAFLAFLVSARARSHRPQRQLRVPAAARRRRPPPGCGRSPSCGPTR